MPDNNFATARDVGTLAGTRTLKNSVGKRDKNDFYKFTLSARSSFSLSLKGLNANADLGLFTAPTKGSLLARSNRSGKKNEQVTTTLEAGTYYIKINSADSRDTRYVLSSSATLLPAPSPAPAPAPIPPVSYYYGYGLVNASAAVARAIGQTASFADVPDSSFADQWGLDKIKVPEVRNQGFRGQGVVVAVIDSGVNYLNPDLSSKIWTNPNEIAGNGVDDDRNGFIDDTQGWDFAGNNNVPLDFAGHGTFVAGIVADDLAGVAPAAKIMPVKVENSGSVFDSNIADGIYYAVRNGAKIINISYGNEPPVGSTLQQAIRFAYTNNVLVVTAAGNSGDQGATRPLNPGFFTASNDYGITVGAIDRAGKFADFSNPMGNSRIDYVAAPGIDVYSNTLYSNEGLAGLTTDSGTSFSAPYVVGVAALMLSANPSLTPAQIENILTATANFGGVTVP